MLRDGPSPARRMPWRCSSGPLPPARACIGIGRNTQMERFVPRGPICLASLKPPSISSSPSAASRCERAQPRWMRPQACQVASAISSASCNASRAAISTCSYRRNQMFVIVPIQSTKPVVFAWLTSRAPPQILVKRLSGLIRESQMPKRPGLVVRRSGSRVVAEAMCEFAAGDRIIDIKGFVRQFQGFLEAALVETLQSKHPKPDKGRTCLGLRFGERCVALGKFARSRCETRTATSLHSWRISRLLSAKRPQRHGRRPRAYNGPLAHCCCVGRHRPPDAFDPD